MKGPVVAACLLAAATLAAQSVDQALLLKPLANEWPTYSGDYSGKRYSALTQINQKNVRQLSLAWTRRLVNGPGPGAATDGARDHSRRRWDAGGGGATQSRAPFAA